MDNLTHSLFGLAAGELVQRSLAPEDDPARQRTRSTLLRLAGFAASNFPDLDLFATRLLPAPLGYLLHHRGHTHTLLFALLQALLLGALIWLLWPAARVLLRESRPARVGLALCCVGGVLLHIGFDFLNSYGVHPFYPFDARWVYGDLVFILEPVFWIAFGIPLAMTLQTRVLRWLLLALPPLTAVLAFKGYLLWSAAAALIVLAALLARLGRAAGAHGRVALTAGMGAAALFVALQAGSAAAARASLQGLPKAGVLLDAALTAYPANPLCWSFATVQRDEAEGRITIRRGVLSTVPGVLPVQACPAALGEPGDGNAAMTLTWEQAGSLAQLRVLARSDCRFAAWMRFARIPVLTHKAASDARYEAGPGGPRNFSTLDLKPAGACPTPVPGWGMPREDLLQAPTATP